jgi:hypothetical protein
VISLTTRPIYSKERASVLTALGPRAGQDAVGEQVERDLFLAKPYSPSLHGLSDANIFKNSVRTSQETHYVSATEPNRLMLFRETVAVYCENHTGHTNSLCGQNSKFLMLKQVVHIVTMTS